MEAHTFEREKLDLEKEKITWDTLIREKEIRIKDKELHLKEKEIKNSRWQPNALILAAIFGFLGTFTASYFQGVTDQRLERLKFESEIILKVATSDSIEQNKKNLKFLLSAGFITDGEGKIKQLVNDSNFNLKIDRQAANSFTTASAPHVYICNSASAKAYHHSENCRGLSRCLAEIKKVTLDEALQMNRKRCGYED